MTTAVEELMSSPPVTCPADASLAEATALMDHRQIGSVVVTERDAVVGILTERDLLRAAATGIDPRAESVRRWMTADPDVVGRARPGRHGLVGPDPPPLPPPSRGGPRGPGRRGLTAGPAERGPDPAGRRGRRRGAPGSRGGGGGRDVGGRRPWPAGLLPLPAVLGHRPGRRPVLRGRLAPAARRGPPRPPAVDRLRRRGRRPPGTAPRAGRPAARPGPVRLAPGRPPDRRLTARSRAGMAPGAGHRRRATPGPGPPTRCRGAHHPRPPPTGCATASLPSRPGRTSPTPPTTCGC